MRVCVTARQHVLQGVRVGGSESHELVNVEPNCIELQASDLSGAGLKKCVAGEQAEVFLMPRDALGNANASLSAEEGALSLRLVVESSDGTQTAAALSSDVSKAGRLKVRRRSPKVCECTVTQISSSSYLLRHFEICACR